MHGFTKKALPAAISLALGTATLVPAAAQAGWYVGVGIGSSDFDNSSVSSADLDSLLSDTELGSDVSIDTLSGDDSGSDTGYKVVGGYRFNNYFALEGQYADLGSTEVSLAGSGTATFDGGEGGPTDIPFDFTANADQDIKGFGISAVGSWPLADWMALTAKLGVFRWDGDIDGSVNVSIDGGEGGSDTLDLSTNDEGIDLNVGVGARFTVMEKLGIEVGYEKFQIDRNDIKLISATVTWEF